MLDNTTNQEERHGGPADRAPHRPLVYIVDDKVPVAEYVAAELGRLGYATQVFSSPLAAVTAFGSTQGKPELLIADFSMPEMDGLELMRRCRHLHPGLRVIIISGTVSAKVLQGAGLGANVVLDKPLVLTRLVAAVESLAGGGSAGLGPQRAESPASRRTPERPAPPLIYIVDDEFVVAEMLSMHLLRAGYRTRAFGSPAVAFSAFVSIIPRPTLLITDFGMPEMSGLELTRRCRQYQSGLKVILMSGSVGFESVEQRALMPDGMLCKPFTPAHLLSEVGALVGRASP